MAEKKQEMIMMTQEQFTLLVNKLSESNDAAKKSFARCTKRRLTVNETLTKLKNL